MLRSAPVGRLVIARLIDIDPRHGGPGHQEAKRPTHTERQQESGARSAGRQASRVWPSRCMPLTPLIRKQLQTIRAIVATAASRERERHKASVEQGWDGECMHSSPVTEGTRQACNKFALAMPMRLSARHHKVAGTLAREVHLRLRVVADPCSGENASETGGDVSLVHSRVEGKQGSKSREAGGQLEASASLSSCCCSAAGNGTPPVLPLFSPHYARGHSFAAAASWTQRLKNRVRTARSAARSSCA